MMAALTLDRIAARIGADYRGAALSLTGVAIDSRRVAPGDLFVAIPGARVDGHDYVAAARDRGAVAAVVQRPVDAQLPCLQVADCLQALTEIGRANRDAYRGTLIAITGSCGKTSVKNMCHTVFSVDNGAAVVATAGNYNNEIGVPLTLARLRDDTRFAVVEMGATRRGDVAHLCRLARPQISTVLNAMEAHLEGFGSVADVADIKAEIFDALDENGFAILNLDQPWASLWRERVAASGAQAVTYALASAADVTAAAIRDQGIAGSAFELHIRGDSRTLTLPLPGRHNVANALAAAALATAAGLSIDTIVAGLERCTPEPGRLSSERLSGDTVLVDDSYNANPGSVRAAIQLLARTPGHSTLILGEMLELGDESRSLHAQMGQLARDAGLRRFVGVGAALQPAVQAFGSDALWFADRDALAAALPALLAESDTILVKGSRGAAMEKVLADLRELAGEGATC
jgi:UDP-N-acetylmuramoyl-tripeptide--D-alanyl-D-alanine ligase